MTPVSAHPFQEDGIYFDINDNKATVTFAGVNN